MTKSELIEVLTSKQPQITPKQVEAGVRGILESMIHSLANGQRI